MSDTDRFWVSTSLLHEPSTALFVQDVIAIQKGHQDVDVQQCAQVDLEAT